MGLKVYVELYDGSKITFNYGLDAKGIKKIIKVEMTLDYEKSKQVLTL